MSTKLATNAPTSFLGARVFYAIEIGGLLWSLGPEPQTANHGSPSWSVIQHADRCRLENLWFYPDHVDD